MFFYSIDIQVSVLCKLEIRDSQNLAKPEEGCTTKLSYGGGGEMEFLV